MKQFVLKKNILNFALTLFTVFMMGNVWGQTQITPTRTAVSGFGTWSDTEVTGTGYLQLLKSTSQTITPDMDFSPYGVKELNFKARTYGGANPSANTVTVSISVNYGSWIVLGTRTPSNNNLNAMSNFDLTSYSGNQIRLRFQSLNGTGSVGIGIDEIEITGFAPLGPTLSVSPTALTNLDYVVGSGPSAVQTLDLDGVNLDGTDVTLTLSNANFEISLDNSSWSTTSFTLSTYSGTTQTVYVRLKSGLMVAAYTGQIDIAGGGATTIDVAVDGEVTPIIAPTITSSLAETVVYGDAVSYQITASDNPTSFNASGLPAGLSINTSTGEITGTVTENVGTVNSTIVATNSGGSDSETLVWTIDPKPITVSGLTAQNKIYDGNTNATVTGTGLLGGVLFPDIVNFPAIPLADFSNKNVGSGKTVTLTPNIITGASAGNYVLTPPTLTADITPLDLTVINATADNKTYDGNNVASISNGALVGVIPPDDVTLLGGGTFASQDVATGIVVTSAMTLGGADASNYTLTQPTGLSADITPASQTITFPPISDKVLSTGSFTVSATSSSGEPVVFTGTTPTINVVGTTVNLVSLGAASITASVPASLNYLAATDVVQGFNVISGPCHEEDMGSIGTSTSYDTRIWAGDGGYWSATDAREDQTINGDAITVRNGEVTSPTFLDGIGSITMTTQRKFGGGDNDLTVKVNGTTVGTIPYSGTAQTNTITGINVSGSIVITIETPGNGDRVAIDDINWTCYTATPEPEINITGNGVSILDGDMSPVPADDTDFGSTAAAGGTVVKTYTIENSGTADLDVTGITSSNATEFAVGGITFPATILASSTTTFTVTFDPANIGLKTSNIVVANNDTDEPTYTYAVQGVGVNSASSDIVPFAFPYTSNINYLANQGLPAINSGNSVASFGFTIRDGGASANDGDALGTTLTDISFLTTNISNVRSAALTDAGGTVLATATITATEIVFTGLPAADFSTLDDDELYIYLYVAFNTTVIDNDQLQYTVSSATADASGSIFATADAGGATSDITGDRNRLEVTASQLAFSQQPITTSINTVMAPSPQVAAVDANGSIDLDVITGNVGLVSTGSMTAVSNENFVNGIATFGTVTHTVAGTGLNLTASSTGLGSIVSSAFDITQIVYNIGDYRSTSSGSWHSTAASSTATWEQLDGTGWNPSTAPGVNSTSLTTKTVYIQHTITLVGNNTAPNVVVLNGGILNTSTVQATFGNLTVKTGGVFYRDANGSGIAVGGIFEVEDDATVYFKHTNTTSRTTSIWQGIEKFHPNSNFVIYHTDNAGSFLFMEDVDDVSYFMLGRFGNLIIDQTAGKMQLLPSNFTGNLTKQDLIFRNAADNFNFCNDNFNAEIGRDFIIESTFTKNATIMSSAKTATVTVNGNFLHSGSGDFRLLNSQTDNNASVTFNVEGDIVLTDAQLSLDIGSSSTGTSIVNLYGDLTVNSAGSIQSVNSNLKGQFNFVGTGDGLTLATTQEVDILNSTSAENSNIDFNVENGAYVQLKNNYLTLNQNSSLNVEAGGTLDFGFSGTTPLYVVHGSGATSVFHSYPSSILKITSPQGIVSSGANGNVRTTTRTFDNLGDFHYIGLENQSSGNALPSSIRNLYINNSGLAYQNFVTIVNGQKNVHNSLSMIQGHVVSTPTNLLSLGASTSELGTLNYTSGYVLGTMRRWFDGTSSGNSEGLFPMGLEELGLKNRHVKVEFNNAPTTGGYLDATFISSPMGPAGLPILMANTGGASFDVTTAEDQGYWKMDNQSGTLNGGSYTISLTGEGFEVITDLSKLTVLKRVVANGPDWFCPGTHLAPTGTIAMPIISRAGITGWSNFGFGGDYDMNPLPIELTAFEVACVGNGQQIEINWTTASETNSSHYIIEKSRDGINWSEVAEVNAAGNSTSIIDYQEIDLNPWNDVSYYRLKQFDFDGNMSAFGPISTSCVIGESEAKVYPNPSTGEFTVEIDWNESAVNTKLQIIDLTGKVVHVQEINLKEGVKQIHFNQMNLQSGVYFVVLQQTQLKPLSLVISK